MSRFPFGFTNDRPSVDPSRERGCLGPRNLRDRNKQIKAASEGKYNFVFTSPEALFGSHRGSTISALKKKIQAVFIDEIHRVAKWLVFLLFNFSFGPLTQSVSFISLNNQRVAQGVKYYVTPSFFYATTLWKLNRGYYTVVRRYEFYVRVARTISHSFAALTREILFLPREHKIHIFKPTCNVLFIIWTNQFNKSKRRES